MKKIFAFLVAFLGLFLFASPAFAASVIYNNVDPAPSSVPSLGYEATSTSEFGGQVEFAGTDRYSPTVTVLMVSWACESGNWNLGDCVTTPGATFTHPVTLNIYAVNPDNSPGAIIATQTQTFTMPYRPSADPGNCNGDNQKWFDGQTCIYGYAFPISFDFSGTTLPDKVIFSVAYNTSHYGANPLGITGPYDSLNVGTEPTPSVGKPLPTADDAYLNSTWGGAYCDSGLGTGTFRLDADCWGGYLPAFKVEASALPVAICHLEKKSSTNFHLIYVDESAVPAHIKHGDGFPGKEVPKTDYVFADDCSLLDFVETVEVDSVSSTDTLSSSLLEQGHSYVFKSSGEWTNSLNVADTEYASNDNWATYFDGYDISPWFLGPGEFDLKVDGAFVDWGLYSSSHNYTLNYTGTGDHAHFLIFDGDSNTNNLVPGWYGDNHGSLTVNIYEQI